MARWLVCLIVAALLAGVAERAGGHLLVGAPARAGATPSGAYTITDPDLFIAVPDGAERRQPLQVLVAIHGMGGDGTTFCRDLLGTAARNGWVVVAPTFRYQDYKDPALVLQDDTTLLPSLNAALDRLPERLGLALHPRVLLYGYSRGAQAVHRFATYYPERVLAVAALSAGSYTLPLTALPVAGHAQPLPMPYGVADMRQYLGRDFDATTFAGIPFRIAVGAQDITPEDAPRAWDPYLGTTRVARAHAYAAALTAKGMQVALGIYPDTGHGITQPMRDDALAFLQAVAADGRVRRTGYGAPAARHPRHWPLAPSPL